MTGKVVDYLVRFVDHKDSGVALVALETLYPVFKEKPLFLQKHKAKIKTVSKACRDLRLKEICAKILPDVQQGYVTFGLFFALFYYTPDAISVL